MFNFLYARLDYLYITYSKQIPFSAKTVLWNRNNYSCSVCVFMSIQCSKREIDEKKANFLKRFRNFRVKKFSVAEKR